MGASCMWAYPLSISFFCASLIESICFRLSPLMARLSTSSSNSLWMSLLLRREERCFPEEDFLPSFFPLILGEVQQSKKKKKKKKKKKVLLGGERERVCFLKE